MAVLKFEQFTRWTLAQPGEKEGTWVFFEAEFGSEADAQEMLDAGEFMQGTIVVRKEYTIRFKGD